MIYEIPSSVRELADVVREASEQDRGRLGIGGRDVAQKREASELAHFVLVEKINELFPDAPVVSPLQSEEENIVAIDDASDFWVIDTVTDEGSFEDVGISLANIQGGVPVLGLIKRGNMSELLVGGSAMEGVGITYYGGAEINPNHPYEFMTWYISAFVPSIDELDKSSKAYNSQLAEFIKENYGLEYDPKSLLQQSFGHEPIRTAFFPSHGLWQLADSEDPLIYVDFTDDRPIWQVAAGQAILEAAGGKVTVLETVNDGSPRDRLSVGRFLAVNRQVVEGSYWRRVTNDRAATVG